MSSLRVESSVVQLLRSALCFVVTLSTIFLASVAAAGDRPLARKQARSTRVSVPVFARALGIELANDSTRRLERRIGRGEVVVGGHPNGGRQWIFRDGLKLYSDGFDWGRDGLILDILRSSDWTGELGDNHYLRKWGVGIWSNLRVGMPVAECLKTLPKYMQTPKVTAKSLQWQKSVTGRLGRRRGTFVFSARVLLNQGRVQSLSLDGDMVHP